MISPVIHSIPYIIIHVNVNYVFEIVESDGGIRQAEGHCMYIHPWTGISWWRFYLTIGNDPAALMSRGWLAGWCAWCKDPAYFVTSYTVANWHARRRVSRRTSDDNLGNTHSPRIILYNGTGGRVRKKKSRMRNRRRHSIFLLDWWRGRR